MTEKTIKKIHCIKVGVGILFGAWVVITLQNNPQSKLDFLLTHWPVLLAFGMVLIFLTMMEDIDQFRKK